ncbi:hypothetical protein JXB02_06705 [Candidatus Woesearchaeota archaeon]|nr:hypothetical protein [Candidatus Woesearchaeota archaeon]
MVKAPKATPPLIADEKPFSGLPAVAALALLVIIGCLFILKVHLAYTRTVQLVATGEG